MRPPELSTDAANEWLAWQHALGFVLQREGQGSVKAFVSVPATAPLRIPADVDACVELLQSSDADLVFVVTPSHRNPYFNMIHFDEQGLVRLVAPPGR